MKAYIPQNLDLGTSRHLDKYYFIITMIYYGRILDKRNTAFSFIPLNGKKIKYILGGRYKKYIKLLIDSEIIESNNQYFVGILPKGYRFSQRYSAVPFKQVIIKDNRIIEKYNTLKYLFEKEIKKEQHKFLYQNLQKINFDYESAQKYVLENISETKKRISYLTSSERLKNKDYFFIIDQVSGRIYNNITNLPKELRRFLNYGNNKLVEIDIRNSQPFFFNLLINNYYTNNITNGNITTSYGHHTKTEHLSSEDVELYKRLTSDGTFYEYMMPHFPTQDREKFKKLLFGRIFYNDEGHYFYDEWGIFQDIFPNVAKIISFYKKDCYKRLSHELQKVEADFMINRIVPILAEQQIFVLTIHDSFLTTPDKAELVKKVMLDEFKKHYSLNPTIKIKKGE